MHDAAAVPGTQDKRTAFTPPPPPPPPPPLALAPDRLKAPWKTPIGVGLAVLAGTAYTGIKDPNTSHAFPLCPLKYLTGWDCPACGCLRAVHSLTRMNVVQAADHNLLFTLAVPFLVVGWGLWLARTLGVDVRRRPPLPSWALWVAGAVVVVFTVSRNLPIPVGTWLNSS